MAPEKVNADKPHLWKADVAASVDQFNQWFMQFAPRAFRSTRIKTTEHVKAALRATRDLRGLDCATLRANPSALPTLRMCTAPPLAVDRLVGLSGAGKSLIGGMEAGRLAPRMKPELLDESLNKDCVVLNQLLDRDIFPWLDAEKAPTDQERERASTIVADRLCSAVAKDAVLSARRRHQRSVVAVVLDSLGYREAATMPDADASNHAPGAYAFDISVPLALGAEAMLRVDVCVLGRAQHGDGGRMFLDIGSARSSSEARADVRRAVKKHRAIELTYGDAAGHVLMLGGAYDAGCLGVLAAGGVDWVWQHRPVEMESWLSR